MAPISWTKVLTLALILLMAVMSLLWWFTLPSIKPALTQSKNLPPSPWLIALPTHNKK